MKTKLLLPLFLITIIGLHISCNITNQEKDKMEIAEIIEKETMSFFNNDYDAWESCWKHSPDIWWGYYAKSNSQHIEGWEEMANMVKNHIGMSTGDYEIPNEYKSFIISHDMAWVRFEQNIIQDNDPMTTLETRTLEKIDGQWYLTGAHIVRIN
jgi:hypothetical protein